MKLPAYMLNAFSLLGRGNVIKTTDLIKSLKTNIERVKNVKDDFNVLYKIDDKKLLKEDVREAVVLFTQSGIEGKNLSTVLKNAITVAIDLAEISEELIDAIEKDKAKFFILDTLSPRQSAILMYGQRLMNGGLLLAQLCILTTYKLQHQEVMYKSKESDMQSAIVKFSPAMRNINRKFGKQKIKEIAKLSNEHTEEKDLTLNDKHFVMPGVSKFSGNPIYHIRLWWLDGEFNDYEKNKYERKLLTLKLAELEMKASSEEPPMHIQEQIAYYEDEIHKLDVSIKEFRDEQYS